MTRGQPQLTVALMRGVSYQATPSPRLVTATAARPLPEGPGARAAWGVLAAGPATPLALRQAAAAQGASPSELAAIAAATERAAHEGWLCHQVVHGHETLASLRLCAPPVVEPARADPTARWCLSPHARLRAERGVLLAEHASLGHRIEIPDPLLASLLATFAAVPVTRRKGAAAHLMCLAISAGLLVEEETAWRQAAAQLRLDALRAALAAPRDQAGAGVAPVLMRRAPPPPRRDAEAATRFSLPLPHGASAPPPMPGPWQPFPGHRSDLGQVSMLLWHGLHTVAAPGAPEDVEAFIALRLTDGSLAGIWRYDAVAHALELWTGDASAIEEALRGRPRGSDPEVVLLVAGEQLPAPIQHEDAVAG